MSGQLDVVMHQESLLFPFGRVLAEKFAEKTKFPCFLVFTNVEAWI